MNREELILARKNYDELMIVRQSKINDAQRKLNSLEEDYNVKEYLKLNDIVSEEGKMASKEIVLEESFGKIANNTKQDNRIYIFIGYYGGPCQNLLSSLKFDNPYARYNYYINLETREIRCICKNKSDEFEKENRVIYLDDPKNYHDINFYETNFKKIRNEFFESLVNNSQECSVKQLIKNR